MIKFIDKGTASQHLTDRLMESAFNNFRVRAYVDDVYIDLIDNRLPVWLDELQTYDVKEETHGRWEKTGRKRYYADAMCVDFEWKCSCCGKLKWAAEQQQPTDNYCYNCGSRMDLEGDTE